MFHIILSLAAIATASSKCLNFLSGDSYYNSTVMQSSYCASVIRWPITEDTARTYEQSDTTAKNLYKKLYDRYKAQKNQELNVDCLGIARYIFCAYANPTCIPANKTSGSVGSNQGKGVCKWLCDLWMVRCPSEFELYGTVCSRIEESNCSNGVRLVVLMFVLLLIL